MTRHALRRDADRMPNGWTRAFTADWMRACRYATRVLAKRGAEWHDDKHSTEYMALRNGYLAGYQAGRRVKR